MSGLISSSNNEITDSKEICKEVEKFYHSQFYSRKSQLIDFDLNQFLNEDTLKISDGDKEITELYCAVTKEEAAGF